MEALGVAGAAALAPVVAVCPRAGIAASDTGSATKRRKLARCAFMISSWDSLYPCLAILTQTREPHTRPVHVAQLHEWFLLGGAKSAI
jgi:hypothetical protein